MKNVTLAMAYLMVCAVGMTAVQVDPARGVDPLVDYEELAQLAPWDDRNYELTAEDVALLSVNEAEAREVIPVFFRVELRREMPNLRRSGPAQYPRSALQKFRLRYDGYQVDGKLYRNLERVGDRIVIDFSEPWMRPSEQDKALSGDVRVSTPTGGAESAVAINPVNSNIVVAGSNGPTFPQTMFYSSDGGSSWTTTASDLPLADTCCDPTVAWSSDGTKAYAASLQNSGNASVLVYRSGDNGQTWNDLVNEAGADPRRELGSATDKEYLHVDTKAGSACLDNVYIAWHEGNVMKFSHSTDRAHTWSTTQTHSGVGEDGIGNDITSDSSGNVYHFWPALSVPSMVVRKSTNCGASFAAVSTVSATQGAFSFPVPSMDTREVFMYVAAAADISTGTYGGSVYAAWTDSTGATGGTPANNHARIQVAYSRNAGTSWNVTTPHSTGDANTVDRYHPWIAVGPDGTVHVVYYDTRNDVNRMSVDLYWATSTDGAQTWAAPQKLTSQISPKISDGFEFGDYNGLDVAMNQLIAIFTDNRVEGGGGGDSVDVWAAGATVGSAGSIFDDDFEGGTTSAWSNSVP